MRLGVLAEVGWASWGIRRFSGGVPGRRLARGVESCEVTDHREPVVGARETAGRSVPGGCEQAGVAGWLAGWLVGWLTVTPGSGGIPLRGAAFLV